MTLVLTAARHEKTDLGERIGVALMRLGDRRAGLAGAAVLGFVAGVAVLGARKVAMQTATGLSGDWLSTLKADHKLVDGLFEAMLRTRDHETGKRQVLLSKIAYALAKHEFEEEHVIYPVLRSEGRGDTPRRLDGEHFDMKTLTHDLSTMAKDDLRWLPTARALHKLIREHAREEDEILYPALKARLTKRENARLTRALHREGLKLA